MVRRVLIALAWLVSGLFATICLAYFAFLLFGFVIGTGFEIDREPTPLEEIRQRDHFSSFWDDPRYRFASLPRQSGAAASSAAIEPAANAVKQRRSTNASHRPAGEYPTLNGGEGSRSSTLPSVVAAGFRLTAIVPASGPLAAALHAAGVEVIAFPDPAMARRPG